MILSKRTRGKTGETYKNPTAERGPKRRREIGKVRRRRDATPVSLAVLDSTGRQPVLALRDVYLPYNSPFFLLSEARL